MSERTDKERLDWLDARVKDESAWVDLVIAHDFQDGVWLSRLRRGDYSAGALDDSMTPLPDVRSAIDAAIERQS